MASENETTDDIVIHKLAEVAADCAWCEREYGQNNNDMKGNQK